MNNITNIIKAINKMNAVIVLYEILTDEKSNLPSDYRYVYVNQSFLELTGLSREKVIDNTVENLFPQLENQWINFYNNVAFTGQDSTFEGYAVCLKRYFKVKLTKLEEKYLLAEMYDITEYNMVYNEIKKYKTFFDNAYDIILTLDNDGELIDCNERAVIEYGYTKEELLNLNISDIRKSNIKKNTGNHTKNAEEGSMFESIHFRKDGTSFPVEVRSIGVDINGEKYLFSIIRNISERKAREQKINELASIVESSKNAVISRTYDGIITSWNAAAVQIFGYEKEEAIGKHISILLPNDESRDIQEISNKIFNGEDIDVYEQTLITKNGTKIIASLNVSPIRNEDNEIVGIALIARDITAEKERNKTIEKLLLALEQSSNTVIITNTMGNIEYVNKKFEKTTGYKREEVLGKHPKILSYGTQSMEFHKQMLITIANGSEWIGEFCSKKKDGSLFWWNASITSIKDKYGITVNYIAIAEDITEKKKLIESLHDKNKILKDTLEQLKETQVKLIQEDKMASIGQLSAGIAHEINNPLGYIMSNFNTLKKYTEKFKDAILEYKKICNKIENDVFQSESIAKKYNLDFILEDLEELYKDTGDGLERVRKIVMALRNFSHEDLSSNLEDYNLNDGINSTLIIARNEIKYTAEVKKLLGEIPLIRANGSEINQVILNLVINASHAIKEKIDQDLIEFGEIKITTYNDDKFVYCTIEDNGIGISEEYLNKVFNPFFTTKPSGKGTGLGLSISYDIIKNKHKGYIDIESKLNIGTKVNIALPIYEE